MSHCLHFTHAVLICLSTYCTHVHHVAHMSYHTPLCLLSDVPVLPRHPIERNIPTTGILFCAMPVAHILIFAVHYFPMKEEGMVTPHFGTSLRTRCTFSSTLFAISYNLHPVLYFTTFPHGVPLSIQEESLAHLHTFCILHDTCHFTASHTPTILSSWGRRALFAYLHASSYKHTLSIILTHTPASSRCPHLFSLYHYITSWRPHCISLSGKATCLHTSFASSVRHRLSSFTTRRSIHCRSRTFTHTFHVCRGGHIIRRTSVAAHAFCILPPRLYLRLHATTSPLHHRTCPALCHASHTSHLLPHYPPSHVRREEEEKINLFAFTLNHTCSLHIITLPPHTHIALKGHAHTLHMFGLRHFAHHFPPSRRLLVFTLPPFMFVPPAVPAAIVIFARTCLRIAHTRIYRFKTPFALMHLSLCYTTHASYAICALACSLFASRALEDILRVYALRVDLHPHFVFHAMSSYMHVTLASMPALVVLPHNALRHTARVYRRVRWTFLDNLAAVLHPAFGIMFTFCAFASFCVLCFCIFCRTTHRAVCFRLRFAFCVPFASVIA